MSRLSSLASRALVLLLLAHSGAHALAQDDAVPSGLSTDEEARMRFELGRRYYDVGRFAEAGDEFEASARLSGRTELLYNLFLARRDAGQDAQAVEALAGYVASLAPGSRRTQLEARLAVMRERVAHGETARDSDTATEPSDTHEQALAEVATPAPAPPPPTSSSLGVAPWVVLGGSAALGVASLVTGVLALDTRASLEGRCMAGACPRDTAPTLQQGQSLAIATDVLWVSAALLAATGIVLAIVDASASSDAPPVHAALACADAGCVAFVGWSS